MGNFIEKWIIKLVANKAIRFLNKKTKDMFKSPKTTWAGILAFIAAGAEQARFLMDGDPLTNPDWTIPIMALLVAIGLISARDNDKKSESVGAK